MTIISPLISPFPPILVTSCSVSLLTLFVIPICRARRRRANPRRRARGRPPPPLLLRAAADLLPSHQWPTPPSRSRIEVDRYSFLFLVLVSFLFPAPLDESYWIGDPSGMAGLICFPQNYA